MDILDKVVFLNDWGIILQNRYCETRSDEILNQAIATFERAVRLAPSNHPQLPIFLNNLSDSLRTRSELSKSVQSMQDLSRAVALLEEVLELETPHRSLLEHNYSNALLRRFERNDNPDDLDKAINASLYASENAPDAADRAMCLNTLAIVFQKKFEQTGLLDYIHRSIKESRKAVGYTDQSSPNRATVCNTLGNALRIRFEYMSSTNDADDTINWIKEAIKCNDRLEYRSNLGDMLRTHFERNGRLDDLEEAIEACKYVVAHTPHSHPSYASRLNNLGNVHQIRYEWHRLTGSKWDIADLNEAVERKGEAVKCIPEGYPSRAILLNNYGSALRYQSEETGSNKDLDDAISAIQKAVESLSPHHPNCALFLNTLRKAFELHYERNKERLDFLTEAIEAFRHAFKIENASPTMRITAANSAARLLYQVDIRGASEILKKAVQLLPRCSPQSLGRKDQQFILASLEGLASNAAALILESVVLPSEVEVFEALETLELGRGVLASLQLELGSDIADLEEADVVLAADFKRLRDQLDAPYLNYSNPSVSNDPLKSQEIEIRRRNDVVMEFDSILDKIRSTPGFQRFLLGPTRDDIMKLAVPGPIVVINIGYTRSDAFIVTQNSIRCLSVNLPFMVVREKAIHITKTLQQDTLATRQATNAALKEILEWLWNAAVSTILEVLGFTKTPTPGGSFPHVWWVPCGLLNMFPIHAAGYHRPGDADRNAIDRVISSYAPTLKALQYARRTSSTSLEPTCKQILLIAMPKTPGHADLPYVNDEIAAIRALFPISMTRTPNEPPTKKETLRLLSECIAVHFAVHGESVLDNPSASRLLLCDYETDSLTVSDLAALKLKDKELAYLSACHSARIRAESLQDEGIHMTGPCLLAGFPQVVGTLWKLMTASRRPLLPTYIKE